jgi:TPR repeat protein
LYNSGMGVPRDYLEAAKWAQRAAEQGYARAQTDLGFLYEQGRGVSLDYVSAYMWYESAAAGGDERARGRIKELSRLMTKRQIAEATRRATRSAPQSATLPGNQLPGASFVEPH